MILLELCKLNLVRSIFNIYNYDLHRWVFGKSIGGKCVYWSKFLCMLNIQFHIIM